MLLLLLLLILLILILLLLLLLLLILIVVFAALLLLLLLLLLIFLLWLLLLLLGILLQFRAHVFQVVFRIIIIRIQLQRLLVCQNALRQLVHAVQSVAHVVIRLRLQLAPVGILQYLVQELERFLRLLFLVKGIGDVVIDNRRGRIIDLRIQVRVIGLVVFFLFEKFIAFQHLRPALALGEKPCGQKQHGHGHRGAALQQPPNTAAAPTWHAMTCHSVRILFRSNSEVA